MSESKVTRPESLATRVRRGVALLDRVMPGWHDRIDVDTLDINFCHRCVLGQLFGGNYDLGVSTVFVNRELFDDAFAGFDSYSLQRSRENAALTRLWAFVVRTRQAARRDVFYAHRDGDGIDLVYRITPDGTVTIWSELYGWHASKFGNLNEDSEYDRAHFADHLDVISAEQLPVGAR